jgi:ribulose kinase
LKTYKPNKEAKDVYDKLFQIYMHCHDHFGRECPEIMKRLKEIRALSKGGLR